MDTVTPGLSQSPPPLPSGPTLLLAGPTAVGKTEIALSLAEKLKGEIVSVDSMQVYRGMDIGTAKPTPEERRRIPHHLLDVVELTEPFDAAQFVHLARQTVREIHARGRLAILCGGTGLYFKAYLEGLGEGPASDPSLRAELEQMPLADLLQELAKRDPVGYERIDRKNPRRVIRAIQVMRLTGKPWSSLRAQWAEQAEESATPPVPFFGLCRASEDLHTRINVRVEEMFRRGLVAETEALIPKGLAENIIALQALGYRQVVEHLRGERNLAETVELVKSRTRQFARRQMTWFRRQARLRWVNLEPQQPAEQVAGAVAADFETFLQNRGGSP